MSLSNSLDIFTLEPRGCCVNSSVVPLVCSLGMIRGGIWGADAGELLKQEQYGTRSCLMLCGTQQIIEPQNIIPITSSYESEKTLVGDAI